MAQLRISEKEIVSLSKYSDNPTSLAGALEDLKISYSVKKGNFYKITLQRRGQTVIFDYPIKNGSPTLLDVLSATSILYYGVNEGDIASDPVLGVDEKKVKKTLKELETTSSNLGKMFTEDEGYALPRRVSF